MRFFSVADSTLRLCFGRPLECARKSSGLFGVLRSLFAFAVLGNSSLNNKGITTS